MSPERWGEIKTVFLEALETPLTARPAFLDRACGSDAGMRDDLEALLAAAEGTSVPPIRASTFARALQDGGNAPFDSDEGVDVLALHEALERLAVLDPKQARLVELRYFGGLTIEETAEALDVSPATVKRDWAVVRAWLRQELATP